MFYAKHIYKWILKCKYVHIKNPVFWEWIYTEFLSSLLYNVGYLIKWYSIFAHFYLSCLFLELSFFGCCHPYFLRNQKLSNVVLSINHLILVEGLFLCQISGTQFTFILRSRYLMMWSTLHSNVVLIYLTFVSPNLSTETEKYWNIWVVLCSIVCLLLLIQVQAIENTWRNFL